MKDSKLPFEATEYIAKRFREEFLFEVKESRKIGDRLEYVTEVSKDGYIHTLCFDDKGRLLKEETELAFPTDPHDPPAAEDVPE